MAADRVYWAYPLLVLGFAVIVPNLRRVISLIHLSILETHPLGCGDVRFHSLNGGIPSVCMEVFVGVNPS